MKKKILLLAVLSVLITGCGKIPKTKNNEDVLVELKSGTKYSVDEIWNEFKKNYALDLILEKIDAEVLEDVYKKNKDDVDEYVDGLETYFKSNYETEEEMINALNRSGYESLDKYKEEQRIKYLRNLATTEYAKKQITDKEIEKYYKEETVGDIEAVHILVKPEGTEADQTKKAKEKAQSIIKDIKKDIKSGTKPKDAFKKYENDTSVTYQDLGKFNKGDMVAEFENAAYALKKGEFSNEPIKTSYGFHIILKIDEYDKPSLKDAKEDIIEKLADKKTKEDTNMEAKALNELRKANKIKFYDKDLEDAYNKYMNYLLNKK